MKVNLNTTVVVFLSVVFCGSLKAQEADSINIQEINQISVAIMDFESKAPGNPEFGSQISDILTARMSIYDQYQLVERKKLDEILQEYKLNLSGAADSSQAIKVGKLVGAKIMIFGKAFPVDKDFYIVAKIIGTETSKVKGVMAKGKLESELSDILDELVEKLSETLEQKATELLPKNERYLNKLEQIRKQLEGKELPKIAVIIPEIHVNREIIDPAAETEIKKVLGKAGFEIMDIEGKGLSKWARDFMEKDEKPLPSLLSDVDYIIVGEGFSEFATRMNDLYSCTARLEINVIKKENSEIVLADRTTQRAIDLSELIAGKNALQAAGHELAFKIIEKVASDFNSKPIEDSPNNR